MKTRKQPLKQLAFAIIAILFVHAPAQAQNDENIVDRVSKIVGVSLPVEYENNLKEWVEKSKVLKGAGEIFTQSFIIEQMNSNWGIDKSNQLLFLWDAIYEQILKKQLYTGEDANQQRLNDFEKVLDKTEECGKMYKEGFFAYMDKLSAEAKQQSAVAKQQSAVAKQQTVEALTGCLKLLAWFFNHKEAILPDETQVIKNNAKRDFTRCKENNLNYKAILREELGDDKKVQELLQFYGVE